MTTTHYNNTLQNTLHNTFHDTFHNTLQQQHITTTHYTLQQHITTIHCNNTSQITTTHYNNIHLQPTLAPSRPLDYLTPFISLHCRAKDPLGSKVANLLLIFFPADALRLTTRQYLPFSLSSHLSGCGVTDYRGSCLMSKR
eukprot:TRINITY_DN3409_c0_g1_i5.p1 TRINITY_DN3409_c0_g1~~TRINITY_DN3409_c0_g1_i5.p1  ORF type:complete len:141 (+),score=3.80 TRINITY_DN3409_c0_g1_i5:260-682(+)